MVGALPTVSVYEMHHGTEYTAIPQFRGILIEIFDFKYRVTGPRPHQIRETA